MPLRNLILVVVAVLVSLACFSVAAKNRYANIFAEALEVIDQEALQEVPPQELFNSAMSGMLKNLDEHSAYISGEKLKAFDEDLKQEFGGVGMYVEINPENNRLFVLAPIPDTPAFDAGLKIGDEIVAIDDKNVIGLDRSDAVKLLRGLVGEPVDLTVERNGKLLTKRLVRAAIPVPSVTGDFRSPDRKWQFVLREHPRLGYIRLNQFGEKSAIEFEEAYLAIGSQIDGLILDLRNNSGGLLDVAIRICDLFLDKDQVIVSTRGRGKKLIDEIRAETVPLVKSGLLIVVLVNRNSASASEIVAGCLQDHHVAVVIGEQTWGKGTVQNIIPVQRGESALKLTTASYWRPSGKQIDRHDAVSQKTKVWGVQPNPGFEIQMTKEEVFDNLRYRSIRDLEALIPAGNDKALNALKSRRLEDANIEMDARSETSNGPPVESGLPTPDDQPNEPFDQDHGMMDAAEPIHIDRPMQRAIEYFKSVLGKQLIAA